MATYFVNANGSNTPPFNTPAKGAPNFAALVSSVGTFGNDIIEVVSNGVIYDVESIIQVQEGGYLTIRSYGTNGTDREYNKPLIKTSPTSGYVFRLGTAGPYDTDDITIQNLRMYKDESEGTLTGNLLHINLYPALSNPLVVVEGCEFFNVLTTDSARSHGLSWGPGRSLSIDLKNNIMHHLHGPIIGGPGNCNLYNNTFYDFTDSVGLLVETAVNNIFHGNNNTGVYAINSNNGYVHYNCYYQCPGGFIQSAGGSVGDNINVDPLLANVANDNYTLQKASPCFNTGISYTGVPTTDYLGITRPQAGGYDMGAYERIINAFTQDTATYGQVVTSSINVNTLISAIQDAGTDTYFDETSEIHSVSVRYTHGDGRQKKVILHRGNPLTGIASWSDTARDGTWEKDRIITTDADGAKNTLIRSDIGSWEDIVMSDGTMTLNT